MANVARIQKIVCILYGEKAFSTSSVSPDSALSRSSASLLASISFSSVVEIKGLRFRMIQEYILQPEGGVGYLDLVWSGVCRPSLKTHPTTKGSFLPKKYPFLRIFLNSIGKFVKHFKNLRKINILEKRTSLGGTSVRLDETAATLYPSTATKDMA